MLEKIKKIFSNKEKKTENLIVLLIILIITLLVINTILNEDDVPKEKEIPSGAELAYNENQSELEGKLENILTKISGVRPSVCFSYIQ